jgi:type VI secretion system protein ImpH
MAGEDRGAGRRVALFDALEAAPHKFDFFQALREIECAFPELPRIGEARRPQDEPVRFAQDPSLAFASSTLTAFVRGAEGMPPRLVQAFMGLLGPNGPLPLHLTEFARDRLRNSRDPTLVRFLDVFHHRMVSLFYRAWSRGRPTVTLDRSGRNGFALYLGALIGLDGNSMRGRDSVPDAAKRAVAGLLGRQARNTEGLESILKGYFRVPVRVEECVAHWMPLPEHLYTRLGDPQGAQLGRTAVIGARVWDLQSKFRIVVGPLSRSQYERFLPGEASFEHMRDWVRNYVGFEYTWDCRLALEKNEVPPLMLGYSGRLGWTTWLNTRVSEKDADDLVLAGG